LDEDGEALEGPSAGVAPRVTPLNATTIIQPNNQTLLFSLIAVISHAEKRRGREDEVNGRLNPRK